GGAQDLSSGLDSDQERRRVVAEAERRRRIRRQTRAPPVGGDLREDVLDRGLELRAGEPAQQPRAYAGRLTAPPDRRRFHLRVRGVLGALDGVLVPVPWSRGATPSPRILRRAPQERDAQASRDRGPPPASSARAERSRRR